MGLYELTWFCSVPGLEIRIICGTFHWSKKWQRLLKMLFFFLFIIYSVDRWGKCVEVLKSNSNWRFVSIIRWPLQAALKLSNQNYFGQSMLFFVPVFLFRIFPFILFVLQISYYMLNFFYFHIPYWGIASFQRKLCDSKTKSVWENLLRCYFPNLESKTLILENFRIYRLCACMCVCMCVCVCYVGFRAKPRLVFPKEKILCF